MQLTRREALFTVVRGGVILCGANAAQVAAFGQTGQILRNLAMFLGEKILTPAAASVFTTWASNAVFGKPNNDGSFHDAYQPGLVFRNQYDPQRAEQFPSYFGVSEVPNVARQANLPQSGEYNVPELQHLGCRCNDVFWGRNGFEKLPIPNGLRRRPTSSDVEQFHHSIGSSSGIGQLDLHYARDFCNCYNMPMKGFGYFDYAEQRAKFQIV